MAAEADPPDSSKPTDLASAGSGSLRHEEQRLVELIGHSRSSCMPVAPGRLLVPDDLPLAYRVQDEAARRRMLLGTRRCGWKVGAANSRQQAELGPAIAPTRGTLFADAIVASGTTVDRLIAPMVEPEIGFVLATDLPHPVHDRFGARAAVARAVAVLEVVDSVWTVGASLADVVADNASAGLVVVGADLAVDLDDEVLGLDVEVSVDHVPVGVERPPAAGWAHPLDALVALARRLAETGRQLASGDLVISGGICAPVVLAPGSTVSARFGELADVSVSRR